MIPVIILGLDETNIQYHHHQNNEESSELTKHTVTWIQFIVDKI